MEALSAIKLARVIGDAPVSRDPWRILAILFLIAVAVGYGAPGIAFVAGFAAH